jgi:hypothetical protein
MACRSAASHCGRHNPDTGIEVQQPLSGDVAGVPTSTIDPLAAAVAAVVAAQLMEVPAYLQRRLGLPVRQDIFDEGGSILRVSPPWRRPAGWLGHAALAIAIVLLYAAFFAAVARNDHLALWGLFAGVVHGLLGGVVVGAFEDLHPRMPHEVPAPGVFYRHYGRRDVLTFVAGHLWFGAMAAVMYALLHNDLSAAAAI